MGEPSAIGYHHRFALAGDKFVHLRLQLLVRETPKAVAARIERDSAALKHAWIFECAAGFGCAGDKDGNVVQVRGRDGLPENCNVERYVAAVIERAQKRAARCRINEDVPGTLVGDVEKSVTAGGHSLRVYQLLFLRAHEMAGFVVHQARVGRRVVTGKHDLPPRCCAFASSACAGKLRRRHRSASYSRAAPGDDRDGQ